MDTELWKQSAKAALDIMNTGLYSLDGQESANNFASKEVVLMRLNAEATNFERYNFPLRFTYGARTSMIAYGNFPSQNLVDAFETANGYRVTLENTGWVCDDPDFNPQAPYENRDKRFYRTILANGMTFKESTVETFKGGIDDGLCQKEVRPPVIFYAGTFRKVPVLNRAGNQPTSTIGQFTVMRKPCSPMQNPWLMLSMMSTTLMRLMCIQHCGLSTK